MLEPDDPPLRVYQPATPGQIKPTALIVAVAPPTQRAAAWAGNDGFRAGWARLARFVRPTLREREARLRRAMRENDGLLARISTPPREISRLTDRASKDS